jgi:hypothetical protein
MEVFEKFQKIIQASPRFYHVHAEQEALCYDLVLNAGLEQKTYRVRVVPEDATYSCGCTYFEMCGLLCPHIIRVMVHLNVQEIPSRYLLHRWSATATTPAPDPGTNSIRFGVPGTNTLKYNALCRKMNDLASDACFTDATYTIVSKMVDEASKMVATMRRDSHGLQQEESVENVAPPAPPPNGRKKNRDKQKEKAGDQDQGGDEAPDSSML